MTDYELYINDVLCDLSPDEDISLVYQSGIFQELDIVQSNRSYDIDLPMTSRNIRAIEHAQRLDVNSDTPYKKLPARLYKGGVPIFTTGMATITEINDTISVVLTWGNVDNFQPLFDSEMHDLADTLYDMGVGSIPWNKDSVIVTGPSESSSPAPMGFYAIDFGQGLSKPEYLHPSIMVYKVLEAIERRHGITIDGIGRLSPTHLLPCVSKNGDEISNKAEALTARPVIRWSSGYISFKNTSYNSQLYDIRNIAYGTYSESINVSKVDKIKIKINNTSGFDIVITNAASLPTFLTIKIIADKGDTIYEARSANKNFQTYHFEAIDIEIDTKEIDRIFFRVRGGINGEFPATSNMQPIWKFTLIPAWEDVICPSIFPIGVNLPDMTQGDFLTSLLAMNGLFPYTDKDHTDTIKLMSADDLFSNLENGVFVDWSRKVLVSSRRNIEIPASSEFSVGDYAQRNTLDYENDDEFKADTSGEILIENENLEKEFELASIPFSASNNTSVQIGTGDEAYPISIASIPIYETNEANSQKVNYIEMSPRILDYKIASSPDMSSRWAYGVFNASQRFNGSNGIVSKKYASLQRILKRFRLISVQAKLTPLDLYNLKYEVPVYISQFGDFFAIYSIETGANGICECSLVKLNAPAKTVSPHYYIQLNGENKDAQGEISPLGGELNVSFATNGVIRMNYPTGTGIEFSLIDPVAGYALFRASRRIGYGGATYNTQVSFTIDEDPSLIRILTIKQHPLLDYQIVLLCPALSGKTESVSFEFLDGAFYADDIMTTFGKNGSSSPILQSKIMQAFGLRGEELMIDFDAEGVLKATTNSGYIGEGKVKYGNIFIELEKK